ncbi:MAG: GGDEF domain-containing protein [Lachnospiraceae bacterium]|nr:GGDEF domain-containing protein [Lachnospiraceae bacterium]
MELEYFSFYTEANLVCVAIFILLIFQSKNFRAKTEQENWFIRTGIVHIVYFLSDVGWAAVESGVLPRVRFFVLLFNFTNYVFMQLIGYSWFMYMAASEGMLLGKKRRFGTIVMIPTFVSVFAIIVAYVINPSFWISKDGVLSDLYYPFMVAVPALYVISSSVISLKNAKKTGVKEEKRLFRLIALYPLAICGFGMLQTFALNAPLFCFGITLMMLYFYIKSLQMLVSVDFLTKLNNRGQIDRYMENIRYSENESCCVCMIDIDRFKKINDQYGHAEGDRALTLIADALRQTADSASFPVFIGRYGGDEFVMIIRSADNTAVTGLISGFKELLTEKSTDLPYKLEASVGYDYLDAGETVEDCLKRADEKLYREKNAIA